MVPAFPWPPSEPPAFALTIGIFQVARNIPSRLYLHPSTGPAPSVYTPSLCSSVTCHSGTACPLFCPPKAFESRNSDFVFCGSHGSRGPGMWYGSITVTGMNSGPQVTPSATELWVMDIA